MTTSKADFNYKSIKTFEDACTKLGIDPVSVFHKEDTPDEVAYKKLKVVYRAINNGWVPDWSDRNQKKYFPWFEVRPGGSGFSTSGCDYVYADSGVGSRLCTDLAEKALYIAKQFEAEYVAFHLIPVPEAQS